jgi:hypothetical protein
MRLIRPSIAGAFLLVLATPSQGVYAQSLSSILTQLHSDVDTVRMNGFSEVFQLANAGSPPGVSLRPGAERLTKYAREHAEIAPALIALLERENIAVHRGAGRDVGERYSVDYYGNLIGCVAALRDPRAVHALLGAIATGNMATDGLAALGEAAAPDVLRAARSSNHYMQLGAVITLSKMVAMSPAPGLSRESRSAIRADLLSSLKNENVTVRLFGLRGLTYFPDSEVRSALRSVATRDPHAVRRNGRDTYPVRDEAIATLRKQDALKGGRPLQ